MVPGPFLLPERGDFSLFIALSPIWGAVLTSDLRSADQGTFSRLLGLILRSVNPDTFDRVDLLHGKKIQVNPNLDGSRLTVLSNELSSCLSRVQGHKETVSALNFRTIPVVPGTWKDAAGPGGRRHGPFGQQGFPANTGHTGPGAVLPAAPPESLVSSAANRRCLWRLPLPSASAV